MVSYRIIIRAIGRASANGMIDVVIEIVVHPAVPVFLFRLGTVGTNILVVFPVLIRQAAGRFDGSEGRTRSLALTPVGENRQKIQHIHYTIAVDVLRDTTRAVPCRDYLQEVQNIEFDGELIRKDGLFVVDDLKGLNPDALTA